jgi:TonB-dependent Receptor Plug Domain
VGYYPERTTVDAIDGARPTEVYLATFQSVLDTMKVRARYDRFVEMAGFRDRAKSGLGRFLTIDDIERRQPKVTSELFLSVAGLFVDQPGDIDTKVQMRGLFTDRCTPAIYLNGQVMNDVNASDLDAFVRPKDIAGIEVYAAGQAPPQFVPGLSGCGSIVIWTK